MGTMFTRMNSMRALAMALVGAVALTAGAARAADPIDPRLYLPELKKDESMFVAVVKVPDLLKLDAVKEFRKKHKLDEEFAKEIANVTLDDIAELVIVGAGNGEAPPKTIGLIRFTKDLETKDLFKAGKKVAEPKKIAGYEVYEITEEDESTQLMKVAPATFAVTSDMSEKAVTAYLKHISGKKPEKYPEAVAAMIKGMDGELFFAGNNITEDEEEPEGYAVSIKLGDTVKIAAALKMLSEDAAKAEAEKITENAEDLPMPIPNMKVTQEGTLVRITGSATKDEIKKMVEGAGKMLPFGGGDEEEPAETPETPMR